MKKSIFTTKDIRQIKSLGIGAADVEKQLAVYRRGAKYLKLHRPCAVKDGILSLRRRRGKK